MTSIAESTIENKIQALNNKLQELSTKIDNNDIAIYYDKNDYYNVDVTIRIIDTENVKDCIRFCKHNCFIPKKYFEKNSIDYNSHELDNVMKYLETKCKSEIEKISLKFKPKAELYAYYSELKSIETKPESLTLYHFISVIRLIDPNNEKIKDLSIYMLNQISLYKYQTFNGNGDSDRIFMREDLIEKLNSTKDLQHYQAKLMIFIKQKTHEK